MQKMELLKLMPMLNSSSTPNLNNVSNPMNLNENSIMQQKQILQALLLQQQQQFMQQQQFSNRNNLNNNMSIYFSYGLIFECFKKLIFKKKLIVPPNFQMLTQQQKELFMAQRFLLFLVGFTFLL